MWKSLLALVTLFTSPCAKAQFELPGVDEANVKPGDDEGALATVLDCGEKTTALFQNPEIFASLQGLSQAAAGRLNAQDSCVSKEGSVVCTLDYAGLQSDFETVCESNGGIYYENDHQVACEAPGGPEGMVIYRFTNYPSCYSSECSASDIERWIADHVDDFENILERDLGVVCDSDYEIAETSPPAGGGTCPNRANDTPEKCGPLSDQIQSQDCDCYAFCNGTLVECEKFNSGGAAQIFCSGELIMGCTDALFTQFLSQSASSQLASSAMKDAAWVVTSFLSMIVALMM